MAEVVRERFLRVRNPIMWACLVTAGFVGLIVWFGLAETCNAELFPKGDCPPKWRHLRVAPPNEVGDTLAGLAGVLAFIWLIATVLLQSVELGEQRRVLALQKDEMEEQRKATQDMARAMSIQAKIFEDEQRARDEERAERLLNEKLRSLIVSISEARRDGLGWHFSNAPFDDEFGSDGHVLSRFFDDDDNLEKTIDDAVLSLRHKLKGFRDHLRELKAESIGCSLPLRTQTVPEFSDKIDAILKLRDALSLPQRERLDRMKLNEIVASMSEVYEQPELWEIAGQ